MCVGGEAGLAPSGGELRPWGSFLKGGVATPPHCMEEALWSILINKIGIASKIVRTFKYMLHNTECAVVLEGSISEWFKVDVRVKLGCLLSPMLFKVFLEFVIVELRSLSYTFDACRNMSMDVRYAYNTTFLAVFEKKSCNN